MLITFQDDDDGTGELAVRAENRDFAGRGAAYFSIEQLEEFARSLLQFPLNEPKVGIAGGYWSAKRDATLDQELLGIDVYPISSRGQLGIQVRVATDQWEGDRPELHQSAKLELRTTYEGLKKLSKDLLELIEGKLREVEFVGEDLGH